MLTAKPKTMCEALKTAPVTEIRSTGLTHSGYPEQHFLPESREIQSGVSGMNQNGAKATEFYPLLPTGFTFSKHIITVVRFHLWTRKRQSVCFSSTITTLTTTQGKTYFTFGLDNL